MTLGILEPISRRFWKPLAVLAAIQVVGTVGYTGHRRSRYACIAGREIDTECGRRKEHLSSHVIACGDGPMTRR
jgi:hypothetical protein